MGASSLVFVAIISILVILILALLPLPTLILFSDILSNFNNDLTTVTHQIFFPFIYFLGPLFTSALISLFLGVFSFEIAYHTFWWVVAKVPFLNRLFYKLGR